MQCINCGQELTDNTKYCNKCGKYQPLAKTNDKKSTRPFFANLSIVLFVIALIPIPILLIGIISLLFVGSISQASIIEVIIQVLKLIFITSGLPLILSLICKILSK